MPVNNELSRKVWQLVWRVESGDWDATDCTKAILALPEIAEALAETEQTKKFRRTIGHSISASPPA